MIHTDRDAPQYKRGTEYRDEIGFRMVRLQAPLTWGRVRDTNRLALEDYPGNWECSLMNNGEVWRTWRWRIGSSGMPEVHPEQKGKSRLPHLPARRYHDTSVRFAVLGRVTGDC